MQITNIKILILQKCMYIITNRILRLYIMNKTSYYKHIALSLII